ncbi:aminotransferase class V-fold PLP-dependent enzyme [Agreia sp. VKM Ac-1783]|uniref:aminotransferase class V-fold PLP-dependent enzyme n=1 Tax=Agreia sp. VKM Ac-1783 TaxID=1938889 RepID=UPI000A2ADD7D|nr:aminotransferase class V-fold PLP-dependent enzyme [Agreia sp. VKM Ac-1783]SMQ71285.1 Selenocysteine lyase/Cysteine desulfurase [Agreia sp. VKM Ac-1783]
MTSALHEIEYLESFAEEELYLNHASYGPPSRQVVATTQHLQNLAMAGGVHASATLHSEDARARAAVAALTGTPIERIALTTSTSLGLMQIAFGVSGEVLVSPDEFPANVYPWRRAEAAGLLAMRMMPGGGASAPTRVTPELIRDSLTPSITAVAVSAVDFRTGYRADLAGIRDVIGERLLVVDGIQGFGVIDTDWAVADALAVGGQKWVRGGWGNGFVAFSDRGLDAIRPVLGSWAGAEETGLYDGLEHEILPDARRHTITNLSPFSMGSLASALELASSIGVARIEELIAGTVDVLIDALDGVGVAVLSPRERARRAGIVVAGFPNGSAGPAHAALTDAGVTATLHGTDRIRFAVHATTTDDAVRAAARVLGSRH